MRIMTILGHRHSHRHRFQLGILWYRVDLGYQIGDEQGMNRRNYIWVLYRLMYIFTNRPYLPVIVVPVLREHL